MIKWIFGVIIVGSLLFFWLRPPSPPPSVSPIASPPAIVSHVSKAQEYTKSITLTGYTAASREIEIRSEVTGYVKFLAQKGSFIKQGETLAILSPETRPDSLESAKANLYYAQMSYNGVQKLHAKGFRSDLALSQSEFLFKEATNKLKEAEKSLKGAHLFCPMSVCYVANHQTSVGTYVSTSSPLMTVLRLNPLTINANIDQHLVGTIKPGTLVAVKLADGSTFQGKLKFVGKKAHSSTRTFPIKMTIDNPAYAAPAGMSATVTVPCEKVFAHFINPSWLSLDEKGKLMVKVLNSDQTAGLIPVEMLDTTPDGMWIHGLPQEITLITTGHGFVSAGQKVKITS